MNKAFFAGLASRHQLGEAGCFESLFKVLGVSGVLQFRRNGAEQHLDGSANDFQVAEFLGSNVHEHVVLVRIRLPAGERLGEVLHGGFEFTIGSAELFQKQRGELGIGFGHSSIELEFLYMMKHSILLLLRIGCSVCGKTSTSEMSATGNNKVDSVLAMRSIASMNLVSG